MKDFVARLFAAPSLVACVAVTLLSACSTPAAKRAGQPYVRKVDYRASPQMKTLAEHARQTGEQMYPAVCALLADGNWEFPRQFDICFKKTLRGMRTGEARTTQVCLNAQYLDKTLQRTARAGFFFKSKERNPVFRSFHFF